MIDTCPNATDLQALLDERLTDEQEAVVLSHIEGCKSCQETLERLTVSDVPSVVRMAGVSVGATPQAARSSLTRVGPFRLERELGRGGMGVVYLAHHTRLRRSAAVKVIRAGADATAEQVARFRNEAEALAAVCHPNVIQVFETGEHEQSAWIALEYIPGGTLRERIGGRPIAPLEAARLMAGVARGAAAAHTAGIVHRDLKPGNVLLANHDSSESSSGPIPKVTDFGLAKLGDTSERLTITGTTIGTPHYMAPEQARGQSAGPASDVYAIGAILYECLTGRPPFDAVDQTVLLDQVVRQSPVPVRRLQPSVPKDLETVCLKCLEKSPTDRYPSATALADDLDRILAGRPTIARPVSWTGHLLRWCRRNPGSASMSASLIAAIVIGALGVTWKWRAAADAERRAAKERDDAIVERQRAQIAAANELRAKEEAEEKLRWLTEAHVLLNGLVYQAAFRLKTEEPDAALKALLAGLDRVVNGEELRQVRDPRLRYAVHASAGHAYRILEKYPHAIRHAHACLADAEVAYGRQSPYVVAALIELAALYKLAGNDAESARFRQRGLDAFASMPDPGEGDRGSYIQVLNYWREWAPETDLAVQLAERLVSDARRLLPADHRDVLELEHALAWARLRNGDVSGAVEIERAVALSIEKQLGVRHERCIQLARDAQTLMSQAGRTDAELFAFVRRSFGDEPTDARLLALRGLELLSEKRWTDAEALLRECLRHRESAEPNAWSTFNTHSMLGESLLGQRRFEEAEPLLISGYRGMKSREPLIPPIARNRLSQAADRLVRHYSALNRDDEAAQWRPLAVPIELGPSPRSVDGPDKR